jgi:hypothetical protein
MGDIKYYLYIVLYGFIILVIVIASLKVYYNNLAAEGFTASAPDNLNSQPWPILGDTGLKPLILSNLDGRKLPVRKLGVSYPGSISYIIGQYLQRKIYPVSLEVLPSTNVVLAKLSAIPDSQSQTQTVDLGFIREPQLIGMSRTELGIRNISVLAPGYWETLYMIGSKYTTFASLAELKRPAREQQIATQRIGVLRDGLAYWEAITRAHELEIGRDFLKSENDNLAELLAQLERRELDAVFLIAHTFDARLQSFLKTNETRMISIYPRSPYPQDTDMLTRPYNPETTDLIAKFKADMKVYIPWIFEETVSLGKPVGNIRQKTVSNLSAGTTGSSIYKTFKIRAYLCATRQLGRDRNFITQLGSRFLEEYQSMALLIQEWGRGGKKTKKQDADLQPKQLSLPTIVFADYDSFNPDLLGALPTEIDINPFMRELIAKIYGRIKIESPEPSCDI